MVKNPMSAQISMHNIFQMERIFTVILIKVSVHWVHRETNLTDNR